MNTNILPRPKTRMLGAWRLKELMDSQKLLLDAEYQRDIKWDIKKMNYLIDSMFTNFYIPPLLFAFKKINGVTLRTAIDGKQRLTAIRKFMNNDFPYIHHITGEEKFYCKTKDNELVALNRNYLSEDELEEFNSYNFVCVEYHEISEDQEFEIFSRVQLGVAITTQEKLKAHNTPIAKVCRDLTDKYHIIKETFTRKSELILLQCIIFMFITLKNERENTSFVSRVEHAFDYIKTTDDPNEEDLNTVEDTLCTLNDIASDKKYKLVLTQKDNKSFGLKNIEMILFMQFKKRVQRPRTLRQYAEDFKELRNNLCLKRNGSLLMGKETYNVGLNIIEQRLISESLTPATRPNVYPVDDSDSDELKEEEYEEPSTPPTPPPAKLNEKRRKLLSGKPTARRGGKLPSGLTRR